MASLRSSVALRCVSNTQADGGKNLAYLTIMSGGDGCVQVQAASQPRGQAKKPDQQAYVHSLESLDRARAHIHTCMCACPLDTLSAWTGRYGALPAPYLYRSSCTSPSKGNTMRLWHSKNACTDSLLLCLFVHRHASYQIPYDASGGGVVQDSASQHGILVNSHYDADTSVPSTANTTGSCTLLRP